MNVDISNSGVSNVDMPGADNPALDRAVEILTDAFRAGRKLLVCGNGGSSADSAHIVGEFVKGFLKRRPLPGNLADALDHLPLQLGLPAIDLSAQGAAISAVANDQGGALAFAQQVLAYCKPGDVVLGISTSGNAENVILALRAAKLLGGICVGLTGRGGGRLARYCDLLIESGETETWRVQEDHIRLYHALCARVEAAIFPE